MARPLMTAVTAALVGGSLNVAVILALFARAEYPALDSAAGTGTLVLTGFTLGFVALLITVYTRLLFPAIGFLTILLGTIYLELTSPLPEWSEMNGHIIVDGPTHVLSYANTWYVWLALLLFGSIVEFGIRRGYGIGDHRLQNLPDIPLSRYTIAWIGVGFAGLVGVATMLLVIRAGIRPPAAALIVFVIATAAAVVPLTALLMHGVLLPTLLFAVFVPYMLSIEVFVTTDSPVHILLFGPYAIILVIAWGVEKLVRERLSWDGGQFAASSSD